MIRIEENVKNVKEYNELCDAVGWGGYDETIAQKALDNTYYSVSIYDDDKIIGYGRLIGDSIVFMYIHDIMVRPEYQGKKYGAMIMKKLLEKLKEIRKENPELLVYLGAVKGKEGFYKKYGFIERETAGLGAGMILDE